MASNSTRDQRLIEEIRAERAAEQEAAAEVRRAQENEERHQQERDAEQLRKHVLKFGVYFPGDILDLPPAGPSERSSRWRWLRW